VYIFISHQPSKAQTARGLSSADRAERIRGNPARAAAVRAGRQRLARVVSHFNPTGKPLSTLRLEAGLSQSELAARMDMQQPNIARLEKKPGDPSMTTLKRLAAALGVTVDAVVAAVDVSNQPVERHE
jgi:ribosome-binding protein aMBF1 (putative translation factor)